MTEFAYLAVDQAGCRSKGSLKATSPSQAAKSLRTQGLYPVRLTERRLSRLKLFTQAHWPQRVSLQEISELCREASLLLQNGMPLDRVLELLSLHRRGAFSEALVRAQRSVLQGSSLGQALQREALIPALLWHSIRSAELSGDLSGVFGELSEHYAAEALLESKTKSTLFYPKIVLLFALLIVAFILVFLMPSYLDVFARSEAALPWATQILLRFSGALGRVWIWILPIVITIVLLNRQIWAKLRVSRPWELGVMRLPYYGNYGRDRMLAHFCRTLAMLLRVGVSIDRALLSIENLPERHIWREALHRVRRKVSLGVSFAEAMAETGYFPDAFIQLLYIGESSDTMIAVLSKSAEYYTHQANIRSQRLLDLLQPMMMLGIALIIGSLAMALLMPLYAQLNLVDNLSNLR